MTPDEYLKGKKVLVMGLGFTSGTQNVKWLVKHGASVTVTDLWPRGNPQDAIKKMGSTAKKIRLTIGKYDKKDFRSCDVLFVNPSVSYNDPYVAFARKNGALIENELTLFLRFAKNTVIGITGTRGKTTTATWTHCLLKRKFPRAVLTGNVAQESFLAVLDTLDSTSPVVAELSSFQLELLPEVKKSPHVAVITNFTEIT
jgi:UDP-N-acetylmuramoylalanine--D-glutamate ligase